MIRTLLLACALAGAAAATMAQTLRVRSGEHGDYTRLVVQVPKGVAWELHQQPDGARLSVALESAVFETDAVFERLSDKRLTSVSQAQPGAALDIAFGCDCVATAFLHRQTMVVIDISANAFKPAPKVDLSAPIWLPERQHSPRPVTEHSSNDPVTPLQKLSRRDLENLLISRVLQGADRDAVDLQLSDPGPRRTTTLDPMKIPANLTQNLHVTSILDEVQAITGLPDPQIYRQPKCIPDAELGFETWSGDQPFEREVAHLRRGLFQEFDRVDPERAVSLAKLYTYYGFGAEARQVLRLMPEQSIATRRISAIADAADDRPATQPNPFSGQQRCDGIAALWALLTEKTLRPDANLNAIERAFARLPQHLRRHFGPQLAELLVEAEKLEASRRVLRAAERVEGQDRPALTLAQARVADAEGNTDQAKELLSDVTKSPAADEEAALALARLVEKRWSDREGLSQREVDLAAAYSVELRRSQRGPMMVRTHALALALNHQFDEAIAVVHAAEMDSDWLRTHDQVARLLAERADDITFLRHTLIMTPDMQSELDLDTAISMSERLVALGFGERAYALANRPPDQAQRQGRARLRAQVALLKGRPRQALLNLSNDESDPAQRLKARALVQAGDFAEAAELMSNLEEKEQAQRYFWLAGQDGAVEDDPQGKFAILRRITQSLSNPIARISDKPIADAQLLLEDSTRARDLIHEMLIKAGHDR